VFPSNSLGHVNTKRKIYRKTQQKSKFVLALVAGYFQPPRHHYETNGTTVWRAHTGPLIPSQHHSWLDMVTPPLIETPKPRNITKSEEEERLTSTNQANSHSNMLRPTNYKHIPFDHACVHVIKRWGNHDVDVIPMRHVAMLKSDYSRDTWFLIWHDDESATQHIGS